MKENLIKKWGAIAKASKNISKKVGKLAIMTSLIAGASIPVIVNNAQPTHAYYLDNKDKGTTADFAVDIYKEDGYWTQSGGFGKIYYSSNNTPAGNYLIQFTPEGFNGATLKIKFNYPASFDGETYTATASVYNAAINSSNAISLSYSTPSDMVGSTGYFSVEVSGAGSLASSIANTVYLRNFTLKQADKTAPVFNGYEGVYFTNYDNPKSLSDILSGITAIDETDGQVTVRTIQDGYTGKERTLGSHIVKLSASDAAGNTTEITIDIRVVDGTKPTISGQTSYTSNMSSPITEASIRAGLTARDNHDSSLTVQLVNDGFTGNEQKSGSYKITYKTTDSSGNVSDIFTVTVTNKDDKKPTIEGTSTYNVSSIGAITSDYIISQLTAKDNIDSNLTIKLVEDNYTANKAIVGDHTMTFNVTDKSGNVSETFTVTISVYDNIPPVFWVSDDFFSVDETLTLTHDDIVAILIAQNGIDETQVVAYRVVEDNYTANASNPGVYAMSYQLQMANGEVLELSSEINVIGEEENKPVEVDEEAWYKNAWNWVKDHAVYFYAGLGALVVGIAIALGIKKKDN